MTQTVQVHPFLLHLLQHPVSLDPVPSPLDQGGWDRVVADATDHGLLPFLYRRLMTAPVAFLPPRSYMTQMKVAVMTTTAQSLLLAQELAQLITRFKDRRLDCIPIRGPALAELLDGDLSTRPMGDLDLLVRRQSLSAVGDLLRSLDYEEIDRRPGFARTFSYTLEFVKERPAMVNVEPHWTIAYPPFADMIDMDAVWRRAEPCRVAGVDTWRLSRTDLLLHLCFHLIHKGEESPLLWWYEIDRLVRQDSTAIDWNLLLETVQGTGQAPLLLRVLQQVTALLHTPVPEWTIMELTSGSSPKDGPAESMQRRLIPLLLGASGIDGRESLALLLTIKGLRAKWHYACGILFPSSEFMRAHYGLSDRSWLGFRYAARLLQVLWEGSKGLVGLMAFRPTQRPPR